MGFPDVCNTPVGPATAPIPYPNIAMNAQAVGFSMIVKVSMVNALNMGSQIPMTSGDEAGVAHPTIKGASRYSMGNPIVSIDRLPAINMTCPTTGNNMNNALGMVAVPSAVNVLYCRAPATDRPLLDELAEAMTSPSLRGVERWPGAVGYLDVASCAPDFDTSVLSQLARMAREGMVAAVIDLRGNAGGELEAALRLAGALLPAGTRVARLLDAAGDERIVTAPAGRRATGSSLPIVLLVDGDTASSAEVFAAALCDGGRAVAVGAPSRGEGTAWSLRVLDGAATRKATMRCFRPAGAAIDDGIRPHVELSDRDDARRTAWAIAAQLAR
jgi:carboxyl-terminal processing protease